MDEIDKLPSPYTAFPELVGKEACELCLWYQDTEDLRKVEIEGRIVYICEDCVQKIEEAEPAI